MLKSNSVKTKALIINEENYYPNSPVTHDFSYSYSFVVDGKSYKADSKCKNLKIGDSILIEYSPINPNFNRPIIKEK